MPPKSGIRVPPHLQNVIESVYGEGDTPGDHEEPTTTEMVNVIQDRSRTELSSYMRIVFMRLGLI